MIARGAVLAAGLLAAASFAPGAASAASWHRYVPGPKSARVVPVRVVSTAGAVRDARRLVRPGRGAATLTMTEGGPQPVVVLDYGRDVGGIPFFRVRSVTGAPTLRASFSESGRFIDADGDNGGMGPCCGNAPPAAEPFRWNEFHPTGPGVLRTTYQQGGERFERIALTSPGSVELRRVGIDFKAFRARPHDYQGWFESSDDTLNKVWYAGAYTLQLDMVPPGTQNDNPEPAVIDGAKRDRLQWSGDTLVEGPAIWDHLGANGSEYVKATLLQYAAHASPTGALATTVGVNTPLAFVFSASYSMDGANAMVDYYRYTGDQPFASQMLPVVRKQLEFDRSLLDARGLIVTGPPGSRPDVGVPPLCCALDWDAYDPPKVGAVAAYNIVYYHALAQAAYLEDHVGDAAQAAADRAQAAALRAKINDTFFDPAAGLYRVSEAISGFPQDANVLGILYGVAPDGQAAGMLAQLKQRLWTPFGSKPFSDAPGFSDVLSPYINGFEARARLAAGDADDALELIRRHYGRMVRPGPDYTGALWEKMGQDGTAAELTGSDPIDGNSLAHGWSTGPLIALSEQVLGVTPVEPGYAQWRLEPELGDLRWAQGQVPTPHGAIRVRWFRSRNDSRVRLEVTAPEGTSGTIIPPVTDRTTRVLLDGQRVPVGDPIVITGGRREHEISVLAA